MPTQLLRTQMPAQASWPRAPIFSGVRCLAPHPSEPGAQTLSRPLWSVGTSPVPQARAGRGNRLCQPQLPCQSRFLFTPQRAAGDRSWRHSPRTSQGPAVQGSRGRGHRGLPWGNPQHTPLFLALLPSPGVPGQLPSGCTQGPPGMGPAARPALGIPGRPFFPPSTSTQVAGPTVPRTPGPGVRGGKPSRRLPCNLRPVLPGPRSPAGAVPPAPSHPHQPARPALSSLKLGGPRSPVLSAPWALTRRCRDPAETPAVRSLLPEAAPGAQVWGGAVGGAGAPPGDQIGQAGPKESHLSPGQRH